MKPSAVVIKKYGNRRLYDTAGSRYVKLEYRNNGQIEIGGGKRLRPRSDASLRLAALS
ncbi:MAG: polyhydroxyalkanoate synthesis regulator DNA-binding domain-containing protein [Candidatus Sulfotelmatobacter sp.]